MSLNKIKFGDHVSLHYRLTLHDGTVADSTFEEEPIHCHAGDESLPDCLQQLLIGLYQGEELTVLLDPLSGWGEPDEEKIQSLPLSDFPADLQPQVGQVLAFNLPNGEELAGTILSIEAQQQQVRIDFNHPLAGRQVQVEIKIMQHSPCNSTTECHH
ncbi:MAG: FKBP-type peptidyl-prolyl cis-trans isomerase [Gammaproteobacteria bacterium]|nr:FKBP-type peptidyl-prolyl cis-trans isomerase [Gammaproteobacteria bacterium]